MKKILATLALAVFCAPAFAQVKCTTGFPGVPPADCTFTWETPAVDAPNIVSFQFLIDGTGTPINVGLPSKTTAAGVDTWTLPAPAPVRALPPGPHTAQVDACFTGGINCSSFSAPSNSFQPTLTTPRSLGVK